MAKSREAFRTISEVSDALDTPTHVLRFWESKFSQIKPVKRAGGRRYYRPEDIDLLAGIKTLLHEHGMTIKGAQKLLREQGVKHIAGLAADLGAASDPVTTTSEIDDPKSDAEAPAAAKEPAPEIAAPATVPPTAPVAASPKRPERTTILAEVAAPNQVMVRTNAAKISVLLAKLETLRDAMRAA